MITSFGKYYVISIYSTDHKNQKGELVLRLNLQNEKR